MKKYTLSFALIVIMSLSLYANNIENIYGKSDISLSNNHSHLYGNNFGSILEYDQLKTQYIDIEYANDQIQLLSSNNEDFSIQIEKYRSDIETSRNKKSEIHQLINTIDLLMVDLRSTSADLYNMKSTLTDSEMRQKLQVSIEENRQQIYDLDNKKIQMSSAAENLRTSIDFSEKFVTVNNLYIRRNNQKINYLEECITFSNKDTSSLDSVIAKSTSFQSEVNNILQTSF